MTKNKVSFQRVSSNAGYITNQKRMKVFHSERTLNIFLYALAEHRSMSIPWPKDKTATLSSKWSPSP